MRGVKDPGVQFQMRSDAMAGGGVKSPGKWLVVHISMTDVKLLSDPATSKFIVLARSAYARPGKHQKSNGAFMKPMQPSQGLAEIVGSGPLPRTEITKKVWVHIKTNKLQNPENKREIVTDAKLRAVFGERN